MIAILTLASASIFAAHLVDALRDSVDSILRGPSSGFGPKWRAKRRPLFRMPMAGPTSDARSPGPGDDGNTAKTSPERGKHQLHGFL